MKIYLVGGAVRDMLMGVTPKDYDYVVTGSTPEEMLSLGYEQVGAAFPVFLHPDTKEEYALARTEVKTGSGYQGFTCSFSPDVTIEADLSRRDLTANSIAYDEETGEYIDPFNGRLDIDSGILRHTSAAFSEDPLRVIRLARLHSRFSNTVIHKSTILLSVDIVNSGELDTISNERYWVELNKVFSDKNSNIGNFFGTLYNFGVLNKVKFFKDILGNVTIETIDYILSISKQIRKYADIDPDMAIAVLIAAIENEAPLLENGIPNRILRNVKNTRVVMCVRFDDAESLHDLLMITKSTRYFSEALSDVLNTIDIGRISYRTEFLFYVCFASNRVLPDLTLTGKAVGEKMKKDQIAAIESML